MEYVLKTSLQHSSLVKIAIAVCNQANLIRTAFSLRSVSNTRNEWQEAEKKVECLLLPGRLKAELLSIVNGIGFQIITWVRFHSHYSSFGPVNSEYEPKIDFAWSPHGTVDKIKTAETFVLNENVDLYVRYRFACAYCLDEYVPVLWEKLDSSRKREIKDYENFLLENNDDGYLIEECTIVRLYEKRLLVFWAYLMDGQISELRSHMKLFCKDEQVTPYRYAFECAVYGGNEVATKYFIEKLTHEEKRKVIVRTTGDVVKLAYLYMKKSSIFPKAFYTDVLCLLFSSVSEDQQIEVLRKYPADVLYCLLEWPWQSYFITTANRMWSFLPRYDFFKLLKHISSEKILCASRDYNYQMLFREFWLGSPDSYRTYVLKYFAGNLLVRLFESDEENSMLILKDIACGQANERTSYFIRAIRDILIKKKKWNLLKFFLQEFAASKEKVKLKEVFKIINVYSSKHEFSKRHTLNKLVKLVDDFIVSISKRKAAENLLAN